jgi:hypothetical protein
MSKIPKGIYDRLRFDAGEEAAIMVGPTTTVYPYYAKLMYLLDPAGRYTPYYVISLGFNYIDGEDVAFAKVMDELSERVNYGIGVGVNFDSSEIEILYGKYNYETISTSHDDRNTYSSTRLTFTYKYKF